MLNIYLEEKKILFLGLQTLTYGYTDPEINCVLMETTFKWMKVPQWGITNVVGQLEAEALKTKTHTVLK